MPDLSKSLPIRGRTLGFLGPNSRLRYAMYRFLVYPWTEPLILCLIIVNAVVLTIQASRTWTLPSDDASPITVKGYLHTWEDFTLFVLFIFFTLEALARICVTGFILDPEIPISSLFTNPFSISEKPLVPSTPVGGLGRQPSFKQTGVHPSLGRKITITHRIQNVYDNVTRPFALPYSSENLQADSQDNDTPSSSSTTVVATPRPGRTRSDTAGSSAILLEKALAGAEHLHGHLRNPSHPAFYASAMRSDHGQELSLPFRFSVAVSRGVTQRNVPYLRHSWLRIDFVAIVSFWITFALAEFGVERGSSHIGIFRALSVLRTARLLAITSGTTTIMRSLKTARPLLASVAYFVLFAMVIFSIVGVQSFNGSLRRSCFLQPTLGEQEIQLDGQACGGYIDPQSLNVTGYIMKDGAIGASKGYICPLGQVCKEEDNPESGIESFDTIYFAALQVVIVASANGWSPLMYSMIDAEFFVSCFFFIICIVVLNFWLINLFVAVITNTFSAIREETHKSAFGAAPVQSSSDTHLAEDRRPPRRNWVRDVYKHIRWCWVALALASLVLQSTKEVAIGPTHESILRIGETVLTIAFDIEIVIRVVAHLPDWRSFFYKGNNWLDLVLAIGSSIIQIPAIFHSPVYPWLTIFQLARFYRVILEIPRMKPLLLSVFGNMYGLANMSLFLMLINYISALFVVQLLRGDLSSDEAMNFGQIFTAFLAIYQVFSSENWTDILYDSASAEVDLGQSAIIVLFVTGWFLFANFIVLQMFIAVINENFNVAEESKRKHQANRYWADQQTQQVHEPWVRRMNPYRWLKSAPQPLGEEPLPPTAVLPMPRPSVHDYRMSIQGIPSYGVSVPPNGRKSGARHIARKSLSALQRLFIGDTQSNDVPMANLRTARKDGPRGTPNHDEIEDQLDFLATINTGPAAPDEATEAMYERRLQKAEFIRQHPTFDKTFWIFSQRSRIRRFCQMLVRPSGGDRIYGRPPSAIAHTICQLVLLLTVIGGIVTESIATPIYRRNFYAEHGQVRGSWFDIAESAFGLMLVVEFIIKIIADGFAFTPNAYLRSIWNILDFIILVGIMINVSTTLIFIGGLSRFTRALKALRALRLITLIEMMRTTFESLIISGASRILEAALLAILYMIPYAVWGLNIFAGLTNQCNDTDATGATDCINEYTNTVAGDAFPFLVPRVWDNPSPSTTFSFDSFRASLLILFEIVSLEGWIDVMGVATSITGADQQPETNASQVNAIFFLIYNLLGAVVILTLFVSIIIGNSSAKTGSALLTQPQREWIDLQKLINRQRPSKRPKTIPTRSVRLWCFKRAVNKHGWWSRMMTVLFTVHIVALMTQTFTPNRIADQIRNGFFLFLTCMYILDITIRFYGLGWRSFRANGWNIYDVIVATGSLITTVSVRVGVNGYAIDQLEKLFLVSIAFKLVQRMNNLNKLFKTAVASLPVILSLLSLWLALFVFFAIMFVEVFSMTKWFSGEGRNQNYSSMGNALVMLAFMSSGEGWNQYMHDYATVFPRCTNPTDTEPDSDCGSVGWAFTLFIAWNLLSMYIFVNMFTGVVVENFSYVFQITGGSKAVTREEMRAFKKVWAQYANHRTGFLERHRFGAFFSKLSGIFEVRIYPAESSVARLLAIAKLDGDSIYNNSEESRLSTGLDVRKLNAALDTISSPVIGKRRNIYSRLYHEAMLTQQPGKGISFTHMLRLLAHHKLIVDEDALVIKDLAIRNETNKLVTDLVNLDRVRSLLKTIAYRRRFLAERETFRRAALEDMMPSTIPAIVVDTLPATPTPTDDIDITTARRLSLSPSSVMDSPRERLFFDTTDQSLTPGSPHLRRSRTTSMLSTDLGKRFTRELSPTGDTFFQEGDDSAVVRSMRNSAWGSKYKPFLSNPHSSRSIFRGNVEGGGRGQVEGGSGRGSQTMIMLYPLTHLFLRALGLMGQLLVIFVSSYLDCICITLTVAHIYHHTSRIGAAGAI
ncbi:hypothetical protein DENSPDRAFT_779605 [Dentipellis sp. KUC8613]|nr:hypothetical protein DENSPDRAFT_779605 [Dentipellis sp. KUC8613]